MPDTTADSVASLLRRPPSPAAAPVDILIVDDHPAKITALESALAPLGQNLVAATSGREALRFLLDRTFATVILDVNMPGMDGFETAQLIRGRQRSASTPIIFVSAVNLTEADSLRGYALGAVDYIPAPIIAEVLRAKVSVFVELHRKTEEARLRAAELEQRTRQLQESQQQLRLAERLAALGTLSAGLGHDLGNLLLPIQVRLDTLETATLTPDVRETLDGIRSCIGYLRRLAQGLRMLSIDPDAPAHAGGATDPDSWWPDVEPMLRNVLPSTVTLRAEIQPGLPEVRLARHLLTQVVFNLVQNAGDALRNLPRGSVNITLARGQQDTVHLAVRDDGPGMPPEVRQRCLEPFFSTKPRGLSTGLGLAFVHGIVQRCGGQMHVDSQPGGGACFTCLLPTVTPLAAAAAPHRRLAYIAFQDRRYAALATTLLEEQGVDLAQADAGDNADLWLGDATPEFTSQAQAFLDGHPDRHIILVGQADAPHPDPRILTVSRRSGVADLRRAIRTSLGAAPRVQLIPPDSQPQPKCAL